MTEAVALYQLQCLDSKADEKRNRLAEVEMLLEGNKAIQDAQATVDRTGARAQQWRRRKRSLELDVEDLSDKITRSEQRLYGGTVGNPKELADLQAEVSSLKRRRQKLEDDLLEAMVEYDEADRAQQQAQAILVDLQAQWLKQQAELGIERERLLAELEETEHARVSTLPFIDPDELAIYRGLRHRKRGRAVTVEREGFCGECGIMIPPNAVWQLRHSKLVQCSNCERFIVRTK